MSKLRGTESHLSCSVVSKQRGVVAPIVVIGLLALLAVAGLALDGSHALGNKTRMQNAADAAALAAAKVLDDTEGDTILATAAANSLFSINASSPGNHEMNDAYGAGDISVVVQYSLSLNPFVPGSFVHGSMPLDNEWWVRVIATGFDTQTTLSKVLGIDEISTPATAVAGPSGPLGEGNGALVCDIAPIAVCDNAVPDNEQDVLRVLKPDPGVHDEIGPGNYKMLRMYDEDGNLCNGGDCLRENLAGSFDSCIELGDNPPPVETEPGEASGPVSQGFNTRFDIQGANLNKPPYYPDEYIYEQGDPSGPKPYELKSCATDDAPTVNYIFLTNSPAQNYCHKFGDNFDPSGDPSTWPESDWKDDLVTTADEINYNYCNYSGTPENCTPGSGPDPGPTPGSALGDGVEGRRLLRFPVVSCDGMANGQSSLDVLGVACFFMLQSLEGSQAHGAGQIFGQYIDVCPASGDSGSTPGGGATGPILYKIQLYKDPDSKDS